MYAVPADSSFQKSSNSNEKKLYKYLKNELYPAVMPSVKVQCWVTSSNVQLYHILIVNVCSAKPKQ